MTIVIGDTQLAFIISSAIMFACFLPAYYKLWKKPTVSRGRKIGYAILFPSLVILGGISTFVFQFFLDWGEVIVFNSIWVFLYLFLLRDITDSSFFQKIPIGKVLITSGFIILFVICSSLVFADLLWFVSFGEWIFFLPLPTLIILLIISILLFILAARFYKKGEEEFTGDEITSGGFLLLNITVATYGLLLVYAGLPIYSEDTGIPTHVRYILLIIGIILLILTIPTLYRERQKRVKRGWGY